MRVAFFSNQFAQSHGHGIAHFTRNLFASLKELPQSPEIVPVATWSDRPAEDLAQWQKHTGLKILPWGQKMTPLLWTYLNYPPLENGLSTEVDLVHAQSLGYAICTRKPFIITIHDIGPLSHPQFFTQRAALILKSALKRAVKQARLFICVSQTTADDLIDYVKSEWQIDLSERVEVILEGVNEQFFEPTADSVLEDLPLPEAPFVLAAGAISPRKNLNSVIKAFEKLKQESDLHLVVVGGQGWGNTGVEALVEQLQLKDRVHFLGYVTDAQLRALYCKAAVFVYPSLFEGFGLTVLEAMASGCPVITSNLSCLPEISGDGALLIDPNSPEELAEAIYNVTTKLELRRNLIDKGKSRASSFTWKRCAQETIDVYNSLT
jgi:glycosyltransferase involved in cell wall biosynthesis